MQQKVWTVLQFELL